MKTQLYSDSLLYIVFIPKYGLLYNNLFHLEYK